MPVDWESEKEIFYRALTLPPEEQSTFLNEVCAGDPMIREEIDRLLSYHARGQQFFHRLEQELGACDSQTPLFATGDCVANRYEIRSFLARGGFGEVYDAHDGEIDERVALKILRSSWFSPEAVERFKTEVRLTRRIASNHVCRVHDVGRFERPGAVPVVFFSMELLEGETLSQRLRTHGPFARKEALAILSQIADGLEAAHQVEVFHRDLKSANIMLVRDPNGATRAVITDFGLAISPEREGDSPSIAGTPAFMAPEQVNNGHVDERTDIYALGIVAYEMVTGHLPFVGDTALEQAQARLSTPPINPRVFNPAIGRRWERAILKCLAREPKKRFASAQEFARALNPPRTKSLLMLVLVIAAALASLTVWYNVHRSANAVIPGSVIVVAFDADGGIERWQSDAFTSDLTAALAAVPGVRVVAQTTARKWIGRTKETAVLRRQLRVASVLSGSIRESPGGISLTVQLADTGSGYLLWSASYNVAQRDLPHVEETIVLASVQALQVRLPAAQVTAVRNRQSQNYDAYEAFAYGQYWMTRRNTQDLEQAIRSYTRAISLDPQYGLAYAGLASAYNLIASRGVMPYEEAFRLSNEAAGRALVLAPELPEALLVKGSNLQLESWDWDGAERYFRRCTQLAPELGTGHLWLAGLLSLRGRHVEALAEASKARDLDPLAPALNASFGTFLYRARRYDAARAQLEWVVKSEPAFLNAKLLLAEVYGQMGREQEAIQLTEAVSTAENRASYALAELGYHYARAGRIDDARQIAVELTSRFAQGHARASEVASVYEGLSELETSCDWLERGVRSHDGGLTVLKVDPSHDILRGNPRFESLVAALKL